MGFGPPPKLARQQEDLEITTGAYGASLSNGLGTVRNDETLCIFANPIREVKLRGRSKGGKAPEFATYATFAIAFVDHEVEKVTRIWLDKKLCYDITGSGPVTPIVGSVNSGKRSRSLSTALTSYMRIYLGTETQEPDPKMAAILDERIGPNSCPAYRGVGYVMLDELPVQSFGGRRPTVTVEYVTASTPRYPYDTRAKTGIGALNGFSYSQDHSRFTVSFGGHFEVWDAIARVQLSEGDLDGSVWGAPTSLAPLNTALYGLDITGDNLVSWPTDGVGAQLSVASLTYPGTGTIGFTLPNGGEKVAITSNLTFPTYYAAQVYDPVTMLVTETDSLGAVPGEEAVSHYCQTTQGDIYAVSHRHEILGSPTFTTATLTRLTSFGDTAASITLTGFPASSNFNRLHIFHREGAFLVSYDGTDLYLIDDQTGAELAHRALTHSANVDAQFRNAYPGAATVWLDGGSTTTAMEISTTDLSTIRTATFGDWSGGPALAAADVVYNEATNALIGSPITDWQLTYYYLDRAEGAGVTLEDIVDDISIRCGLTPGDWDASDLDQTVLGYSWTQASGAEILGTLLEAHDSEVGPHDFGVRFRKRGAAVLGAITTAELVGAPAYSIEEPHDDDLPVIASLSFADPAIDGQSNTARVRRPLSTSDGRKEESLSLPTWRTNVTPARQAVEGWMRRLWYSSETVKLSVTRQHTAWEPGEAYTFTFDDISRAMKITRLEFAGDGRLNAELQRYDPDIHILADVVGAPADGVPPSVIEVPSYTKGLVLDAPLIRDADDGLLVYLAATAWDPDSPWPGAEFYASDDGLDYEAGFGSVSSAEAAVMGTASDALPDALSTVIDYANTLTVVLHDGVLTSCTELEMLYGANAFLLGDEVGHFMTKTLVAPKTYELTGLLRGRRGTEWATGTHAIGDRFVLLDTVLPKVTMGASEVGDTDYYQPITSGGSSGFTQALTYQGISLRPYAPVYLTVADSGGDKILGWTRRTRIGAWNVYNAMPPLGETTEQYVVRIFNAGGAAIRTYSSLTTPTVTYPAADIASDGGLGVTWDARQVSSVVGPGLAATAAL